MARAKYRFYEDAGHGWLSVPVDELVRLGIAEQISVYSYISPSLKYAYLEEDCDLTKFLEAKGWQDAEWRANVKHMKPAKYESAIRRYDHYIAPKQLELAV